MYTTKNIDCKSLSVITKCTLVSFFLCFCTHTPFRTAKLIQLSTMYAKFPNYWSNICLRVLINEVWFHADRIIRWPRVQNRSAYSRIYNCFSESTKQTTERVVIRACKTGDYSEILTRRACSGALSSSRCRRFRHLVSSLQPRSTDSRVKKRGK